MICQFGCKKTIPATYSFPLAMAGEGERVQIATICGGTQLQEKLRGMGIRTEDTIEVVQRREQGAVLITKENTRYALGGGMAHKIYVIKV